MGRRGKTKLTLGKKPTRRAMLISPKATGRPIKGMNPTQKSESNKGVKQSYSIIASGADGRMGANATGEGGTYGEVTKGTMPMKLMIDFKVLKPGSKLLEIGSGAAKVNNHVSAYFLTNQVWTHGTELCPLRNSIGVNNTVKVRKWGQENDSNIGKNITLQTGDAFSAQSFCPFSGCYSYDVAVSALNMFILIRTTIQYHLISLQSSIQKMWSDVEKFSKIAQQSSTLSRTAPLKNLRPLAMRSNSLDKRR